MKLGAFSVSLNVTDLAASKSFYAELGFEPFAGDETQGWLMLRNGETVIGLFRGMLKKYSDVQSRVGSEHARRR